MAAASDWRSNSSAPSAPRMRIERKVPVSNCAVISRFINEGSPFCCESDKASVAALSLFLMRNWVCSVSRAESTDTVTLPASASSTVPSSSNQIWRISDMATPSNKKKTSGNRDSLKSFRARFREHLAPA